MSFPADSPTLFRDRRCPQLERDRQRLAPLRTRGMGMVSYTACVIFYQVGEGSHRIRRVDCASWCQLEPVGFQSLAPHRATNFRTVKLTQLSTTRGRTGVPLYLQ